MNLSTNRIGAVVVEVLLVHESILVSEKVRRQPKAGADGRESHVEQAQK